MRRIRAFAPVFVFLLVLAACGPQATEAPASPPAAELPTEEAPATEAPATEPPTEAATEASVVPAVLAEPVLEVGSEYLFIHGGRLIGVPGGVFTMGDGAPDSPVHEVDVGGFWMDQTEVTNRMYGLCVAIGECSPPNAADNPGFPDPLLANRPVVGVTYDQAATYCKTFKMRLPTEAEWEKAASWDPNQQIKFTYPWGEQTPTCTLENAGGCVGKTTNIQDHPNGASPYLAVDMAGNVSEWTADWYSASSITKDPADNPTGPADGTKRVVRSAGFAMPFFQTPVARRFSALPTDHRNDLGFRCVTTDPSAFAPFCEALQLTGLGPDGQPTGNPAQGKCEPPKIQQVPFCGGQPTIVNFDPPGGSFSAPGCTPTGNPDQYLCSPGDAPGPLSGCGPCQITDPGDWQCPPHYVVDGAGCRWDGTGTTGQECLPGMNYDPVTQCCAFAPGTAGDLGCPAGWYPYLDGCATDWVGMPLCTFIPVPVVYGDACGPDDDEPQCDPRTNPNCPPPGQCPPGCTPDPQAPNGCRCPNGPSTAP